MTTRAKNWILRPYLYSAHWIEEESTILVTDTFYVLTSVLEWWRRCVPKRNRVTGKWKKIAQWGASRSVFLQIFKSRRIRWAEHVACMEKWEEHAGFWWGNLMERDHLDGASIEERIILKWVSKERTGTLPELIGLRTGTGGGYLWTSWWTFIVHKMLEFVD